MLISLSTINGLSVEKNTIHEHIFADEHESGVICVTGVVISHLCGMAKRYLIMEAAAAGKPQRDSGPRFNIKMSYQYRKSHCGDQTVVRSSYLHNGISYTGKTASLYWIGLLLLGNFVLFEFLYNKLGCTSENIFEIGATIFGMLSPSLPYLHWRYRSLALSHWFVEMFLNEMGLMCSIM